MNVIIVEDHVMVRKGLIFLLQADPDITVVGEASDGDEAVRLTRKLHPDIVILDIAMPGRNGLTVLSEIARTGSKVLVLSMYADSGLVTKSLRYGAKGYVVKNAEMEELLLAVRAVAKGRTFISSLVTENLLTPDGNIDTQDPFDKLTQRELEVFQFVVEGKSSLQIADRLHIDLKTIEKHRASLKRKLHAEDIPALVKIAIHYHIIAPPFVDTAPLL